MGVSILFLWQIDAIHLNHVTPVAHSLSDQHCATPKGNWNCIVSPPPLLFSFFQAIRDDVCPPFCHGSEQTKRQPVVICIVVPLPLKIYSTNTHTHSLRVGHVACFPGHFLWSSCFIVFADPISLPLWCDFSFCCPGQSYSHGSPGKEKQCDLYTNTPALTTTATTTWHNNAFT